MKHIALFFLFLTSLFNRSKIENKNIIPTVTPTPTISLPTATPTPKPISFADMNRMYGPCIKVPVLMFHHIQPADVAKKLGQGGLTVTPDNFQKDIEYLKNKGYNTIFPGEIANFFDNGVGLPAKPVVVTLDDAYEDNFTYAYPVLKQYGSKATIFTPSGLVTVPDYLSWNEISEMAGSGLIYFGNHTWSHHSSYGSIEVLDKEISLADRQLAEKGLNANKIFAYPYGKPSSGAEETLTKYGYRLAFTTVPGSIMCKAKRFDLPRLRVGNFSLSKLGL